MWYGMVGQVLPMPQKPTKHCGAVEACWAHNSEDVRSKLTSATSFLFLCVPKMNLASDAVGPPVTQ